jgi:hypothetical protein
MKKIIKYLISPFIIVGILFTMSFVCVNAATGYKGYAVYREGSGINVAGHAGLMDEAYNTDNLPVLDITEERGDVDWASWSEFLNGKTFWGYYRPNVNPSSSTRDNFVQTGRALRNENISYNLIYQVWWTSASGTFVDPNEISSIRCDGVVEFVYEYRAYKVYYYDNIWGNEKWDVSEASTFIRDHHDILHITPVEQIDYLTGVN